MIHDVRGFLIFSAFDHNFEVSVLSESHKFQAPEKPSSVCKLTWPELILYGDSFFSSNITKFLAPKRGPQQRIQPARQAQDILNTQGLKNIICFVGG
jgi:hypothetical protein